MAIVSLHGLDAKKEKQSVLLPKGSEILSVCVKQENILISVAHDVNAAGRISDTQSVEFAVIKEGRHFNIEGYHFLGTVVLNFGNTICQVFYRK